MSFLRRERAHQITLMADQFAKEIGSQFYYYNIISLKKNFILSIDFRARFWKC
jgi:hypothetical protein